MAFLELYCRPLIGSNLNAGTTNTASAAFTYASGSWVQSTGVFTAASGNPLSDGVAVGDYASVYADGSTATGFVGKVTARDATTITVSLTVKSGTAPSNGTNTRTLKIGGAWSGPSAAVNFPFGFVQNTMIGGTGEYPRVNLYADATYSITAGLVHNNNGPIVFSGCTTSPGDGGMATVDAGAAAIDILTGTGTQLLFENLTAQNNSGSANGFAFGGAFSAYRRCIASNIARSGFVTTSAGPTSFFECAATGCNTSAATDRGGFSHLSNAATFIRCVSINSLNGFAITATATCNNCIATQNTVNGFVVAAGATVHITQCDSYDNGSNGLDMNHANTCVLNLESSNFVRNGGLGIASSGGVNRMGRISNCGFGSGTQANTGGNLESNLGAITVVDSVTYAADVTPWSDPDNGDFTVVLAAAQGTGLGSFLDVSGFAGTEAFPDIGAAQHFDDGSEAVVTEAASLDRTLETALVALIDAAAGAAIQVVPNLMGAQEAEAICPRITVWCESQESPDFQEPTDVGIYGVFPVTTVVTCICEATSATSSDEMADLVSSVDAICIYNGDLADNLTGGTLRVFGVIPRGIRQERNGNRLMRHRELIIWARLESITTSEAMLTEEGEVMLTEGDEEMFTE